MIKRGGIMNVYLVSLECTENTDGNKIFYKKDDAERYLRNQFDKFRADFDDGLSDEEFLSKKCTTISHIDSDSIYTEQQHCCCDEPIFGEFWSFYGDIEEHEIL